MKLDFLTGCTTVALLGASAGCCWLTHDHTPPPTDANTRVAESEYPVRTTAECDRQLQSVAGGGFVRANVFVDPETMQCLLQLRAEHVNCEINVPTTPLKDCVWGPFDVHCRNVDVELRRNQDRLYLTGTTTATNLHLPATVSVFEAMSSLSNALPDDSTRTR